MEALLDLMRAAGDRITTSRRLLAGALLDRQGPITAEELCSLVQAQAPDISISTIYRNLEELARLEIVEHSHLGHGSAVYQLTSSAQAHLVCDGCGKTLVAPKELFEDLARQAAARYGFTVDPRHFAIQGYCQDCQTSGAPS
jgi:Fur family transcriptional regulator, ferric uptake regulator